MYTEPRCEGLAEADFRSRPKLHAPKQPALPFIRSPQPRNAALAADGYPVGADNTAIRRTIDANNRRVRWLSASINQ